MTAVLNTNDNANETILTMALELSNKTWRLGFGNGQKVRQMTIESGHWSDLTNAIETARCKLSLPPDCPVVSCYEAGRDGFWIHRRLGELGIENIIIDSSSIEVNRRKRRAKTDTIDVKAMLRLLQRHRGGEAGVMSVVRVPTEQEEAQRRLNRERDRLIKERGAHSSRIKSLLVLHGLHVSINKGFALWLSKQTQLGDDLSAEILREYERYCLTDEQITHLEETQKQRVAEATSGAFLQVQQRLLLKGVGWQSSWPLVMEFFAWRAFRNRREVGACAGLTPTPYDSGDSRREQGLCKAGNKKIRCLMVELSWLWLRYQPDSALSQWYQRRFAEGGKRQRRIGIVAMARKLLVALWRYVEHGVLPEGAVLSP